MNYIKQINHYWEQHEVFSFSANECALYMYLLKRSNDIGWRNPYEVRNSVAMDMLGFSFRILQRSRDTLRKHHLIRFRTTNGSPIAVYQLYDAESKVEPEAWFKIFGIGEKIDSSTDSGVNADLDARITAAPVVAIKLRSKAAVEEEQQIQKRSHQDFLNEFFKPERGYDREAICVQSYVPEIQKPWLQIFNAHLITERKQHAEYQEWLKHFRSWLQFKLPELKNKKHVNGNHTEHQHGKIKVAISL